MDEEQETPTTSEGKPEAASADSAPGASKGETTDPTLASDAEAVSDRRAGARRFALFPVVTAVIIAGLVAALVVTQVQLSDRNSQNGDRTSAVAAAKVFAFDVASYDYRHLRHDFAKVENESTASFRRTFTSSSRGLSTLLVQYHAIATAKVLQAGIVSITSTTAVVILFVNQTISNTAAKGGPNTDNSRVKVTMQQSGGRWLLNDLKVV